MSSPALRHLFHPDHLEDYLRSVDTAAHQLAATMGSLDGPSSGTGPGRAAAMVTDIDLDVPASDLDSALEELGRVYLEDTVWFHEPTYAAHLNCPVVIPALVAELFVSAVNSSLDTFDQSVGGTQIERHLVDWTAGRLGMSGPPAPGNATSAHPAEGRRFGARPDGVFTSGGTQSNLQALLLARDTVVHREGVEPQRLRILVSAEGHFSVEKAARLLGLSPQAVVEVPVDESRRMRVPGLAAAVERCRAEGLVPMAVVATAGTTDFGAIDPLRRIADLCGREDIWLHVDAAYGGGLLASRRRRHLLNGIELADSVTIDFHKTWFLPVSASAVVVRDGRVLRHVTHHADYLNPAETTDPNQVDKSLQTTRRFDALKLWMALRTMGPDTIGDYFDSVIDLAQEVHRAMLAMPDVEVAAAPGLSTLVFRYRPPSPCEDTGGLNARIRSTLYSRGTGMVAATKVDGSTWLKLTLLNPMACLADIVGLLGEIRDIGTELATSPEVA